MYEEDLMSSEPTKENVDQGTWDPNHEQHRGQEHDITKFGQEKRKTAMNEAVEEAMDSARQGICVVIYSFVFINTSKSCSCGCRCC